MSKIQCCQSPDGLVEKDIHLSTMDVQHQTLCKFKAKCAVIDSLTVKNELIIDSIDTTNTNSQRYIPVLQAGSNPTTFISPKYINYIKLENINVLAEAWRIRFPVLIKSLITNLTTGNGNTGNSGFLSIQIADPTTGNALNGVDDPAFIGTQTFVAGAVATHTLSTPLPANTPFVIRIQQSGPDGSVGYRFNIIAVIC